MTRLDQSQQSAVDKISTLKSRIYLLIGAGGSGKTFTIQHLLTQLWGSPDNNISNETTFIAASTGKASKIINDAFALAEFETYNEAKTIHRLLEFNPSTGWGYNADFPLNATLVVLDEASMIDSLLLSKVIAALPEGCILILVGDENQLPPVAPGQPFTDLILCGSQEIVNRLTTNHRQAQGSLIADGCLKVLEGKKPIFGIYGENTLGGILNDDLFFIEEPEKEEIPLIVSNICREWHEQGFDYAVLAPQKTGVCGVDVMNKHLQETLNPAAAGKAELKVAWLNFRVGDRVKQIKNDYGLGVFNGFIGTVRSINTGIDGNSVMAVDFDGQIVEYSDPKHFKNLMLGYCQTIHSAQGSQWRYGVVVCHSSHYYMQSRSLFYTAISRFRQELYVVGDSKAIKRALNNVVSGERNTFLKLRLKGEEM
jgi:exodeoxyribonuclease V alpha subunit